MRYACLLFIIVQTSLCCAASEERKAEKPALEWNRYEILVKRNIFARDRGRGRSDDGERKEKEPPPPKAEASLSLIGIVNKDGQLVAFIENTKAGTVQTVREGDSLASGKVGAITLDKMEFKTEGASTDITIGKTLDGSVAPRGGDTVTTVTTSTPGKEPGSSDANSVLERMRKKRQEALSK